MFDLDPMVMSSLSPRTCETARREKCERAAPYTGKNRARKKKDQREREQMRMAYHSVEPNRGLSLFGGEVIQNVT